MVSPPPASSGRLLFVAQSLAVGGVETMICDLTRLLAPTEFDVEVAVLEGGGALESVIRDRGLPLHHLGKRPGADLSALGRLHRLVRARAITVVHSHNFAPWLYASAALAGHRRRCRHVHTEHSGLPPSALRHALARWCARTGDATIAVSGAVRDILTGRVGIPAARVRVIGNGVDTDRFAPDPADRTAVRAALGIGSEVVTIGIVARLVPVKAHEILVRSFAAVSAVASAPVTLLIVGDGPERARLEALAQGHGLGGRVRFLGERRDTPSLLRAMDIYALASHSEGMNLTLLEAMATALPVVATAVGGNPEIVVAEETGLLVPPADPSAMADRLGALVHDAARRRRLGEAGRARACARYAERTMLDRYLTAYRGSPDEGGT